MIRRSCVAVAIFALSVGACAATPPKPPRTSTVRVFQTGFSARGGALGVAALVRVLGPRPVTNVELQINFLDGRTNFGSDEATIPFCPASTDCWWTKSYGRADVGKPPSTVDDVGVTVNKIGAIGGSVRVQELRVRVVGRSARIATPRRKGIVYVVMSRGSVPRFGWSREVSGTITRIGGPRPLTGERARAFFYPHR